MTGMVTLSQMIPDSWSHQKRRPAVEYSCGHFGNTNRLDGPKKFARKACPPCEEMLRAEPAELVQAMMELAGYQYQPELFAPRHALTREQAEAVEAEIDRRIAAAREARQRLNPSRFKHCAEGKAA